MKIDNSMKKVWRNSREVIIHQASAEQEDSKRLERLVSLLATGMERLLSANGKETPALLDFTPNVLPNTRNVNGPAKTENL